MHLHKCTFISVYMHVCVCFLQLEVVGSILAISDPTNFGSPFSLLRCGPLKIIDFSRIVHSENGRSKLCESSDGHRYTETPSRYTEAPMVLPISIG